MDGRVVFGRRKAVTSLAALAASGYAALRPAGASAAALEALSEGSLSDGTAVQLAGTPQLWVAQGGALHWAGDTRALAGKPVRWDAVRSGSLSDLRALPLGDPWLSTAMVRIGEAIYVPKWETSWAWPQLLHVRSLEDLGLIGVTGASYGRLVLDQAAWEQRYHLSTGTLAKGELNLTGSAPTAPPPQSPAAARLAVASATVIGGRGTAEGTGWIVGEVRNDGGAAAGYALTATLADGDGVIVSTHRAEAAWPVPAGTSNPFSVPVKSLPRGARVEVRVAPAVPAQALVPLSAEVLRVVEDKEERNGAVVSHTFHARGNVRNATGQPVGSVRLLVAFLDRSGHVVDVQGFASPARATAATIEPGEGAGFDVESLAAGVNSRVAGIHSARAYAFGQPQARPAGQRRGSQ